VEVYDSWQWFPGDREILWVSERDGWRHVWAAPHDDSGMGAMRLLTPGDFDVLDIVGVVGVDSSNGLLYFTASPDDATRSYLYRARLDGKGAMERVTPAGLSSSMARKRAISASAASARCRSASACRRSASARCLSASAR
jgi:dipeptidyl-peptidase-4